jgi:1,4-dihydroxy-2-naphthoyl-CoA hydrolase
MKLKQVPLDQLNALNPGTLMEALQISYLEIGDDFVKASMPVNEPSNPWGYCMVAQVLL